MRKKLEGIQEKLELLWQLAQEQIQRDGRLQETQPLIISWD